MMSTDSPLTHCEHGVFPSTACIDCYPRTVAPSKPPPQPCLPRGRVYGGACLPPGRRGSAT